MSEEKIKFKLEKNKDGVKLLKIFTENCSMNDLKERSFEMIEKYKNILVNHEKLCIIIDSSKLMNCTPKIDSEMMFKRLNRLAELNDLAKKKVRCTAIIIQNPIIKGIFDTFKPYFPFVVPTEVFTSQEDAIKYVRKFY